MCLNKDWKMKNTPHAPFYFSPCGKLRYASHKPLSPHQQLSSPPHIVQYFFGNIQLCHRSIISGSSHIIHSPIIIREVLILTLSIFPLQGGISWFPLATGMILNDMSTTEIIISIHSLLPGVYWSILPLGTVFPRTLARANKKNTVRESSVMGVANNKKVYSIWTNAYVTDAGAISCHTIKSRLPWRPYTSFSNHYQGSIDSSRVFVFIVLILKGCIA